jgi:hypothetical protein
VATPAGAAKIAVGNATGTVHCTTTGKVKISPALTNANTLPSTTTAKIKSISCTGTTGNAAVTISKAKGSATSTGTSPGTCTGLLTPGTTPFSVHVDWKATGGSLNATDITYANVGPSGIGFDLPSNGAAGAATSTITGSYAGEKSWSHATIALPDLTLCNPGPPPKNKPAKGIKKLTITGGTIDIFP